MADKKTSLVLGLGAGFLALLLLLRRAQGAPGELLQVSISAPPSLATHWQLAIFAWDVTQVIDAKSDIPIAGSALLSIPVDTTFPLRVDMIIYHNTIIDYRMQSVSMEDPWLPENYNEAFIPLTGSYEYNMVSEQFEPSLFIP